MVDSNNNRGEHAATALDRLIRETLRLSPDSGDWPEETAILAYLNHEATQEQTEKVQTALAKSSSFRRALVDLSFAEEMLQSPSLREAFDRLPESELSKVGAALRTPDRATRSGLSSLVSRFFDWLGELTPRVVLVPAVVVVAAALLLVGPSTFLPSAGPQLERQARLLMSRFMLGAERGTAIDNQQLYASPDSAAYQAFFTYVKYDRTTGDYAVTPDVGPQVHGALQQMRLQVLSPEGRQLLEAVAAVDPSVSVDDAEPQAWFLSLDSLDTWRLPMSSLKEKVEWQPEWGRRICVILVYRTPGGYKASPGREIRL